MKRLLLFLCPFIGLSPLLYCQDNYRTVASGNWATASSWEKDVNGNGIYAAATSAPSSADGSVIIRSGHVITISSAVSSDQLTVASGGVINIPSGQTLTVLNGTGDDLTINGTLNDSGNLIISTAPSAGVVRVYGTLNNYGSVTNSSNTRVFFEDYSTYSHQHDITAGIIPLATWDTLSTCMISGYTTNTTPPSNFGQAFGNFVWKTENLNIANYFYLDGEPSNVAGDFRLLNVGPALNGNGIMFNSLSTAKIFNIGDTLEIANDIYVSMNESATGSTVINTKHFVLRGQNTYFDLADFGLGQLKVSGNYCDSGNIQLSSTTTGCGIYFKPTQSGIEQNFVSINAPSTSVHYIIDSTSNIVLPQGSFFGGFGTLTVRNGASLHLRSLSTSGAFQSGTSGGNIRLSNKVFASGSVIMYDAAAQQYFGLGIPQVVKVIVKNPSGVYLHANTSIPTVLRLDSGFVNLNNFTLTIGSNQAVRGNIEVNKGYITGNGQLGRWYTAGTVSLGSDTGLFPFGVHADSVRYFWISGNHTNGGIILVNHTNTYGNSSILPVFVDNSVNVNYRKNFNWTVSTANGIAGTYRIEINAGYNGGTSNASLLRVSLANGIAPGTAEPGTLNNIIYRASRTGLSAANIVNTFYLATDSATNVLPVKFLAINAKKQSNSIDICWKVSEAKNINKYKITGSDDLKNWKELGEVKHRTGSLVEYCFNDMNVGSGFYRIEAIDFNGVSFLSEIVTIIVPNTRALIYPNPVFNASEININGIGIQSVVLYSAIGSEIKQVLAKEATSEMKLDIRGIVPGSYILKIQSQGGVEFKRVQIN